MKLVTFRLEDGILRAGWIAGTGNVDRGGDAAAGPIRGCVVDMHAASGGMLPNDMLAFLRSFASNLAAARGIDAKLCASRETPPPYCHSPGDVKLCAPLPRPSSMRDFYAFEQHVRNARARRGLDIVPEWYHFPVFYFTNHQAVIGPGDEVRSPSASRCLDFELEIACVIGAEGRNIPAREADRYIAGYCIMNDWSARDLQREEVKVGLGPAKGKDFATSLGPYLVTPDELLPYVCPHSAGDTAAGIRHDLGMTAKVNGRLVSQGNAKDMHFTFAQMIERASADVTLYPGDVIGSGTVGTGCILELGPDVQPWLTPGDVVELEITGLGTLHNRVK